MYSIIMGVVHQNWRLWMVCTPTNWYAKQLNPTQCDWANQRQIKNEFNKIIFELYHVILNGFIILSLFIWVSFLVFFCYIRIKLADLTSFKLNWHFASMYLCCWCFIFFFVFFISSSPPYSIFSFQSHCISFSVELLLEKWPHRLSHN